MLSRAPPKAAFGAFLIKRNFATDFSRSSLLFPSHLNRSTFAQTPRPTSFGISQAHQPAKVSYPVIPRRSYLGLLTTRSEAPEAEEAVPPSIDPMDIVGEELKSVNSNIKNLVYAEHPILARIAEYYFNIQGKRFRPQLILLVSRALMAHHMFLEGRNALITRVLPKQHQLAEIIEMIHTASIVHDDVIDESDTRRGHPSISSLFGNKMAILAGDFLLARASLSLSTIENHEVTGLMSRVISDLVEGEFMQMKQGERSNFESYLRKTYLKTASMIANGCKSAAVLGALPRDVIDTAYTFGKNFGMAFQLVDDLLDFTGSAESLGKPTAVDMKLGLATAPVLYAAEEYSELVPMIERSFKKDGDLDKAYSLVMKSRGMLRTKELAVQHIKKAIESLLHFHPSPARDALKSMAELVVTRKK